MNYSALPVSAYFGGSDQTSAWSYGWDEVGATVTELKAKEQIGFVAATDYALASPLAFALTIRTSPASRRIAMAMTIGLTRRLTQGKPR